MVGCLFLLLKPSNTFFFPSGLSQRQLYQRRGVQAHQGVRQTRPVCAERPAGPRMDFARWGCLIVKCLFFCLLQEGSRYAVLFLGLLNKINNNDAIQYVLTLIDDMIGTAVVRGHFPYIFTFGTTCRAKQAHPAVHWHVQGRRGPALHATDQVPREGQCIHHDQGEQARLCHPVVREDFVSFVSRLILFFFVGSFGGKMNPTQFDWFMSWLGGRLRSNTDEQVHASVGALQSLLQLDSIRTKFFETPDGVKGYRLYISKKVKQAFLPPCRE